MDVLEPEELTKSSDDNKKLSRDSYLSPTFFGHSEIVALRRLMAACFRSVEGSGRRRQANLGKVGLPGRIVVLEAPEHFAVKCIQK